MDKKLTPYLKSFFFFMRNIGGSGKHGIEQRIFNIFAFSLTVFALVGTVGNYLTGLNTQVIVLSCVGCIISGYLFYISRYRGQYTTRTIVLYLVSVTLILGVMYFYNNGMGGTVAYLIIMILNVFVLIVERKHQFLVFGALYLVLVLLFTIEYYRPQWITHYSSRTEAVLDHIITMIYGMFFTAYIVISFRRKMTRDRNLILKKNKKLEKLNNKINYQKSDLLTKTMALERSLSQVRERNLYIETLLQELSHRVKNNLQLVISLLDIQTVPGGGDDLKNRAIWETKNRLTSLILVHQRLYGKENAIEVFIPSYIKELTESIQLLYIGFIDEMVEYDIDPVHLNVDLVIPLGIIVNEIITNSFKHAFGSTKEPNISISVRKNGDELSISIKDNGSGYSKEKKYEGTGTLLINSLVKQLKGRMALCSDKKGTSYTITLGDNGQAKN